MKILAVDTATISCSVAIVQNKAILAEVTLVKEQTHSKHLMAVIKRVSQLSGIPISDLDGFAVTRGPGSFTGLRIGTTLAVIGVTVAEFVGSQEGLGHLMVLYQAYFKIPRMFAAIVLLSLFGYLFYEVLKIIEKKLLPWYREE